MCQFLLIRPIFLVGRNRFYARTIEASVYQPVHCTENECEKGPTNIQRKKAGVVVSHIFSVDIPPLLLPSATCSNHKNTYHQTPITKNKADEKIYETYQKLAKMYTLSIGLAKLCRLSCYRTSVAVYYFHFQTLLRIYRMIDFEIVNMSFKSHKKITLFSSLNIVFEVLVSCYSFHVFLNFFTLRQLACYKVTANFSAISCEINGRNKCLYVFAEKLSRVNENSKIILISSMVLIADTFPKNAEFSNDLYQNVDD